MGPNLTAIHDELMLARRAATQSLPADLGKAAYDIYPWDPLSISGCPEIQAKVRCC